MKNTITAILGGIIGGVIGCVGALATLASMTKYTGAHEKPKEHVYTAEKKMSQDIDEPPKKDNDRFLNGMLWNLCSLFSNDYLGKSLVRSQLSHVNHCIYDYVEKKYAAKVLELEERSAAEYELTTPLMEAALHDERSKDTLQYWIDGADITKAPDEELQKLLDVFYDNLPEEIVESIKKACVFPVQRA